ncbi:hypothetical protein [Amycolatopsis sp. lyj-23]|uniref:hypothetical protein n=1 Tax=Amycolatopsis sp. lyj-23 TaxID=2789283 RepID=UPI00397AC0DE
MLSDLIAGADLTREIDALFVNAPLHDYDERPRVNDFTLPVLGMAYIATYAAAQGFNVGVLDAEAHGLGIERRRHDQPAGLLTETAPPSHTPRRPAPEPRDLDVAPDVEIVPYARVASALSSARHRRARLGA